jgi:hypothetical protein
MMAEEPNRLRILSDDTFERKRLENLGYFIESGDGQSLVMRFDQDAHVGSQTPTPVTRALASSSTSL